MRKGCTCTVIYPSPCFLIFALRSATCSEDGYKAEKGKRLHKKLMDNSWWCCRRARGHQSFFLIFRILKFHFIHRIFESRASMARAWWCLRRSIWLTSWGWNSDRHLNYDRSWWSDWTSLATARHAKLEARSKTTWWSRKASSTTLQKWRFHERTAQIRQSSDPGRFHWPLPHPTSSDCFWLKRKLTSDNQPDVRSCNFWCLTREMYLNVKNC